MVGLLRFHQQPSTLSSHLNAFLFCLCICTLLSDQLKVADELRMFAAVDPKLHSQPGPKRLLRWLNDWEPLSRGARSTPGLCWKSPTNEWRFFKDGFSTFKVLKHEMPFGRLIKSCSLDAFCFHELSRVNAFVFWWVRHMKHTRRIKFFGPSPPARAQRCGMVTGWLAEQVSCLTGTTQRFFFSIGFWTLKAISAWLLGQLVAYSSLIFFLVHASMSCLVLMGLIFRWNAWDAENFIFVLPDKLSQKQVPQPALD